MRNLLLSFLWLLSDSCLFHFCSVCTPAFAFSCVSGVGYFHPHAEHVHSRIMCLQPGVLQKLLFNKSNTELQKNFVHSAGRAIDCSSCEEREWELYLVQKIVPENLTFKCFTDYNVCTRLHSQHWNNTNVAGTMHIYLVFGNWGLTRYYLKTST